MFAFLQQIFFFEKQIKLLKTNYNIVSIDELIHNLKLKKKEKFLLSITFDDGYKDNLNFALPILEHYKIPATIYMTTRFLDTDVWMWWYELKEIIDQKDYLKFNYKEHNYYYELKNYRQKIQAFKNLRKLFVKNMPQKFLITGGSGFIGSNLVNFLIKKKYKIVNLDINFICETPNINKLSILMKKKLSNLLST